MKSFDGYHELFWRDHVHDNGRIRKRDDVEDEAVAREIMRRENATGGRFRAWLRKDWAVLRELWPLWLVVGLIVVTVVYWEVVK